jgi:hypothetical protein
MTNYVEKINRKLAHIIEEEIARKTKKISIKRMASYQCHEYDHLAKYCPNIDGELLSFLNGASSTLDTHMCVMARGSKVAPTLNLNISPNDEEEDNDAFLH